MISGFLGIVSMLVLSMQKNLHLAFALVCLVAGSAGIAFADVAIDACVTQNSISHPHLAGDMQSLCGMSTSIGAFVGFSLSGVFVHLVGPTVFLQMLILIRSQFTVCMIIQAECSCIIQV